ncbi:MAG: MarR family winged helix-turn-helix transcriptional regulator [Sulfuritalea sp.]|nr:MarR family winged helix-turn-helix transcriptional regulator [Sulfuritalea sp.]
MSDPEYWNQTQMTSKRAKPAATESLRDNGLQVARARKGKEMDLEAYIPYQFARLSAYLSKELAEDYARNFGLAIAEWRVIAVLAFLPGATAAEIAAFSSLDAVAVHRAVSRLIQAGLLNRQLDPNDARRKPLEISSEGWKLYENEVPVALTLERRILSCLEPADARVFRRSMMTIYRKLIGEPRRRKE